MFNNHLVEAFYLVVVVSGIPLIISSIGGLLVAILQTATQIQEQTLTHIVKFALVSVVLIFAGGYFLELMTEYFEQSLQSIAYLGRF